MTKREEILSYLPIVLNRPIVVKSSPHTSMITIHAINVYEGYEIWLKAKDDTWYDLDRIDTNDMTANSILQRLRLMKNG